MGGFFGNIIGGILSRLMIMGAIIGGGQYYMAHNGGLSGVLSGAGHSATPNSQPISAGIGGLGAIASSLGIGSPSTSNHFNVQGRINDIRIECRLVRTSGGKATRTEPLSCDRAKTALTYPQFSEYTLTKAQTATYIYYDMDGVNVLKGKMTARRGQKIGDVIDLRIDSNDPRKSTPI